jgi:1,4-dihydroxy-2-naphthoate polyprenyltransferase
VTAPSDWVAGARPRTLPLAVAPVAVGTAAASTAGPVIWWRAVLAAVVALSLQVGVNYANDYSDGVRGTDAVRRGPVRLTASGLAPPEAVQRSAWLSFLVAGAAGAALALAVAPWLLLVGLAAVAAAWFYSGGGRPYGYSGLGEVSVLVFFGFVATAGSSYVQARMVPSAAWWGSLVVGLPTCAVLVVNNLRDIASDAAVGKRTVAVRIGARSTQMLFVVLVAGTFISVIPIGVAHPTTWITLAAVPLAFQPARSVLAGAGEPLVLVEALVATVRLTVVAAALLTVGLFFS